jgi:hypothetical protein
MDKYYNLMLDIWDGNYYNFVQAEPKWLNKYRDFGDGLTGEGRLESTF